MQHRPLLVKIMFIIFFLLLSACSPQTTSDTSLLSTSTSTLIQRTKTSTSTPAPEPTSTPTITPTPIGGKGGLLMYQSVCPPDSDCVYTTFLYNLNSYELIPFIEGYFPLDVSPDGKKVLLQSTRKVGDLFILDSTRPDQKTLLYENVDDAVWLGNSDWVGFISTVDDKGQVFIIHPDGSDLTQMTHSSIGVVTMESAFNDGVFWGEGTRDKEGIPHIDNFTWTKLDGTEEALFNFFKVSPSGRYVIALGMQPPQAGCLFCGLELTNLATGEKTELTLSKPDPDIDIVFPGLTPLTDEKWLLSEARQYWLYSPEGTVVRALPTDYNVAYGGDPPPSSILSSDENWILVSRFEKISDEQTSATYHLLNIQTLDVKDLPNLYYTSIGTKIVGNKRIDGVVEGCRVANYFWVEMP